MKGRPRIVARSRAYAERRLRRVSITQDRSVSAGEDLARAFTLPASAYLDEATFAKERDLIFGRSWQLVGRTDELARVGDLKPATILDEPILITHGLDGKLRGFYNVCRHRAAQVVLSKGNRRSLQCPYHGWTYGLDGRLQVAREMDGTENFDKSDFGLVPIRVERWGPFVFANFDDQAPSLRDVLGRIHRKSPQPGTTSSECSWSSGASTSSNATGRCTSITTWRVTTCRLPIPACSKSSSTTATGSRRSATTQSSTRPSES